MGNEKEKKEDKMVLIIYIIVTTLFMIYGLISMNTIMWIGYFSFLIMTMSLYIIIYIKYKIKDIKDMIKILEEGDNYDK